MAFDAIQKIRQVVASYDLLRYLHVAKLCCETWAKEHQNAGLVVPGRPNLLHFVWQIVLPFARLWYNITYLWNLDEFYRFICLSIYLSIYLSIHPSKIQPAIFLGAKVGATDVEAMKKIRGALPDPRRRETEKPGHLRYFGNFLAMEAMVHW